MIKFYCSKHQWENDRQSCPQCPVKPELADLISNTAIIREAARRANEDQRALMEAAGELPPSTWEQRYAEIAKYGDDMNTTIERSKLKAFIAQEITRAREEERKKHGAAMRKLIEARGDEIELAINDLLIYADTLTPTPEGEEDIHTP